SHVTTMLSLAGVPDPAECAGRILDLETELAGSHWDRVTCRDAHKTYNLHTLDELRRVMPQFDWATWSQRAEVPLRTLAEVVLRQPSYFEALSKALDAAHLPAWTDWLRWQLIRAAAPYLSAAF